MAANDAPRLADALRRQLSAAAWFVGDPAGVGQALEHARHGGRTDLQTLGNGQRRYHPLGAVEAVNGLEVILYSSAGLFRHRFPSVFDRRIPKKRCHSSGGPGDSTCEIVSPL